MQKDIAVSDNALPLWMWGVKEKDMALYKLLSDIIPNLYRLSGNLAECYFLRL